MRVEPGSLLAETTGATELAVNSFHHQAAGVLGEGLRAVAWAPDGLVEAIERPGRPLCLGVQWHAETLTDDPGHLALFELLVHEAAPRPELAVA